MPAPLYLCEMHRLNRPLDLVTGTRGVITITIRCVVHRPYPARSAALAWVVTAPVRAPLIIDVRCGYGLHAWFQIRTILAQVIDRSRGCDIHGCIILRLISSVILVTIRESIANPRMSNEPRLQTERFRRYEWYKRLNPIIRNDGYQIIAIQDA